MTQKNDQAGSLATPEEGSDSLVTNWAGPWAKQSSLCEAKGQGQQAHLGLLYLLAECTHDPVIEGQGESKQGLCTESSLHAKNSKLNLVLWEEIL